MGVEELGAEKYFCGTVSEELVSCRRFSHDTTLQRIFLEAVSRSKRSHSEI